MFDNLTKEIIYYSLIPVSILALIVLFLLFLKKKGSNLYKYNYLIKIILMLMDSIVLSLIVGYSIWVTTHFINNGTLSSNLIYVIVLIVLIVALVVLLIITCIKLYKTFNSKQNVLYEKETYYEVNPILDTLKKQDF